MDFALWRLSDEVYDFFLTSCNVSLPVTVISFNMKYLMTDPERDIEFCFQKISTFS